MTSWTSVEEQNFQELIRRAEQQSREYYIRSGAAPSYPCAERVPAPPPPPPPPPPVEHREVIYLPAPACCPQPEPPKSRPVPNRKPQPAPRPPAKGGLAGILGGLDTETLLLCGLAWLLWQEDADYKIILAIAYILLV